ncbi:MAG TPA: hypothetical protein VI389_00435 [Geobacteraceae bacterium]
MHIVAIHGWKEESAELAQALAAALGLTAFEVRQRLIGGGPAVVARFADAHQAEALAATLRRCGVAALVVDVDEVRGRGGRFVVRRFELDAERLFLESVSGESAAIPYGEIELLLLAMGITSQTETATVTERKFSLGATIMTGGIPVMKKVEREEEVRGEEREKALFLYAGSHPALVFRQSGMSYDGLGPAMKQSRELNFTHLVAELRRLAPRAAYDERLQQRAGQVRVLGPALAPDTNLDLAAEILARTLRPNPGGSGGAGA